MSLKNKLFNEKTYPIWGLTATIITLLGSLITALLYRGPNGQPYSILNYFMSDLGNLDLSAGHDIFNGALIISGLMYLPFMLGIGKYLGTKFGRSASIVGIIASIGAIGVGISPENFLLTHIIVADTFFFGGLITVVLISIDIIRQKSSKFPLFLAILGFVVVVAFAVFVVNLFNINVGTSSAASQMVGLVTNRPPILIMAIEEWVAILSIIAWIIIAALIWIRKLKSN